VKDREWFGNNFARDLLSLLYGTPSVLLGGMKPVDMRTAGSRGESAVTGLYLTSFACESALHAKEDENEARGNRLYQSDRDVKKFTEWNG
jgi:hypothetical protein